MKLRIGRLDIRIRWKRRKARLTPQTIRVDAEHDGPLFSREAIPLVRPRNNLFPDALAAGDCCSHTGAYHAWSPKVDRYMCTALLCSCSNWSGPLKRIAEEWGYDPLSAVAPTTPSQ